MSKAVTATNTPTTEVERLPVQRLPESRVADHALTLRELQERVALVKHAMDRVMKRGVHYDVIPGTKKPSLLQPGADILNFLFRLSPNPEVIHEIRQDDWIAYTVRVTLVHSPTGKIWAAGLGSCNSREKRYRYRWESTGKPVPKAYWDTRDQALLGPDLHAKKDDDTGGWMICRRIDNDNPWDLDNTILKMAVKRAKVAAALNATGAADMFTQDVEDMPPEYFEARRKTKDIELPPSKDGIVPDTPIEPEPLPAADPALVMRVINAYGGIGIDVSEVLAYVDRMVPEEMTEADIGKLRDAFKKAQKSGRLIEREAGEDELDLDAAAAEAAAAAK